MKKLVVFYSVSGTTKKAAEILAREIKADVEELIDKTKRKGIIGYIKAAFHAAKGRLTEIEPVKKDAKKYDLIVIGTPVWVGNIPPAIRTYLKNSNLEKKKVAILITYGGSGVEKTVREIKNIVTNANIVGHLAIKRREIGEAENKIKEWVKSIKLY